jgi:hypothetical protein
MKIFLNNQKNIQVKRASLNAEGLSTYANSSVIRGHFRALNEKESAVNGAQYGQAYMLLTDISSDIDNGDKLTINNQNYNVQSVVTQNRVIGSIKYKKAILSFNS